MTNKTYFVLQIVGAVLFVLAVILFLSYGFGVELPRIAQRLESDPESNAYGIGSSMYFLAVISFVVLGLVAIVTVLLMLGISFALKKKSISRFGLIALNTIVQVILVVAFLFNILSVFDGGSLGILIAIASGVSCILWAVQFWGSVKLFPKTVLN